MTDPFNTEQDRVKYWQNKFDSEFERAKSYEMDIVYLNYQVRELQRKLIELESDNRILHDMINKLEDQNDK